jgi:hypothetical protein
MASLSATARGGVNGTKLFQAFSSFSKFFQGKSKLFQAFSKQFQTFSLAIFNEIKGLSAAPADFAFSNPLRPNSPPARRLWIGTNLPRRRERPRRDPDWAGAANPKSASAALRSASQWRLG